MTQDTLGWVEVGAPWAGAGGCGGTLGWVKVGIQEHPGWAGGGHGGTLGQMAGGM